MNCKNCQVSLKNTDNFCYDCGAKVINERLSFKHAWEEFSTIFLNYDNTFLKTFIHLFTAPHIVIGDYLNGVRKKYLNVVSYVAVAITLAGFQVFILKNFYPETLDLSKIQGNEYNPVQMDWLLDYQTFLFFLNIPVSAFVAKVSFFRHKKFNYIEHLAIIAYIVAQFTITSTLLTILSSSLGFNFYIFGNILNVLLIIYTSITYKKLYGINLKETLLGVFIFLIILIMAFVISTSLYAWYLYQSGAFENLN